MSEKQWEIVQVDNQYVLDEETGTFTTKDPIVRKLLRKRR